MLQHVAVIKDPLQARLNFSLIPLFFLKNPMMVLKVFVRKLNSPMILVLELHLSSILKRPSVIDCS